MNVRRIFFGKTKHLGWNFYDKHFYGDYDRQFLSLKINPGVLFFQKKILRTFLFLRQKRTKNENIDLPGSVHTTYR